jgi:hypothetical protein
MAIDEQNRDSENARPVRQIEDGLKFIDDVDASTQIIGKRENHSVAEGDAKWALKKVTTTGNITKELYAEGEPFDVFNKTWTGRAGYSYS